MLRCPTARWLARTLRGHPVKPTVGRTPPRGGCCKVSLFLPAWRLPGPTLSACTPRLPPARILFPHGLRRTAPLPPPRHNPPGRPRRSFRLLRSPRGHPPEPPRPGNRCNSRYTSRCVVWCKGCPFFPVAFPSRHARGPSSTKRSPREANWYTRSISRPLFGLLLSRCDVAPRAGQPRSRRSTAGGRFPLRPAPMFPVGCNQTPLLRCPSRPPSPVHAPRLLNCRGLLVVSVSLLPSGLTGRLLL